MLKCFANIRLIPHLTNKNPNTKSNHLIFRILKIIFPFYYGAKIRNFFLYVTASYRILPHFTASYINLPHSTDWGVLFRSTSGKGAEKERKKSDYGRTQQERSVCHRMAYYDKGAMEMYTIPKGNRGVYLGAIGCFRQGQYISRSISSGMVLRLSNVSVGVMNVL